MELAITILAIAGCLYLLLSLVVLIVAIRRVWKDWDGNAR